MDLENAENAYRNARELYISILHKELKGQLVVDKNGSEDDPLKIIQFYDVNLLMTYLCLVEPGITDISYDKNYINLNVVEEWYESENKFTIYGLISLLRDSLSLDNELEFELCDVDGREYTLKLSLLDLSHAFYTSEHYSKN